MEEDSQIERDYINDMIPEIVVGKSIKTEMKNAVKQMRNNKAAGTDGKLGKQILKPQQIF